MKFDTLGSFDRDFARLPSEHQQMLKKVIREHFLPAVAAGSFTGEPLWPARPLIHKLAITSSICSLTWSFADPDGRATFHLENDVDGVAVLVWRRIGHHDIYGRP